MRTELNNSGVVFNAEAHTYHLDGKELSGITGMLQRQLFPNEFDGISEYIIDQAAAYGTSVHQSIEDFDAQWLNDGTQEVIDYISICKEYGLVHERSEYTITDGKNWASNIDKVYRASDDTFNIGDIKTYGVMTSDKLEKAKWQLSIYAYLFELTNPDAKVGQLFIIHLRNKEKKDGTFDHIADLINVNRIPADVCKELLDCDLRGEQFENPYSIPESVVAQEEKIRTLIETKNAAEKELSEIKASILADMEAQDAKTWATPTMRITRKLPSSRSSFNLASFKKANPTFDVAPYMKVSNVSGSITISI